jgi:hypothetical protein
MLLALRCGKIARMAEPAQDPALLLREDLSKEYYAILNVVSNYDGWLPNSNVSSTGHLSPAARMSLLLETAWPSGTKQ